MPRGHEYLWTPKLLILEGGANLVIALAALVIAWRLLGAAGAPLPDGGRRGSFCSEFLLPLRIYSTCG